MDNILNMYYTLLKRKDVSVEIQEKAFNYASRVDSVDLFVTLLNLSNLDEAVEEKISKRGEADVLACWASKPKRTTTELLERFKKENRATLLSQLAERDGLPAELYNQLAELGKPSLSQAIIKNKGADLNAKIKAAKTAISGMRGNSTVEGKVKSLFEGQDPQVVNQAIESVKAIGALSALSSTTDQIDSIKVANQLKKIITDREDSLSEWYNGNAIKNIFNRVNADGKKIIREQIKAEEESGSLKWANSEVRKIATAPDVDPIDIAIDAIKTSSNIDEISINLDFVDKNGQRGRAKEAVLAAIENEVATACLVVKYLNKIDYREYHLLVKKSRNCMAALKTILSGYVDSYIQEQIFFENNIFQENVCRDGVSTRLLLKELSSNKHVISQLARGKVGKIVPKEILEYADIQSISNSAPNLVYEEVEKLISADERAWVFFENLLPDWENSLPELIQTAKLLAENEV